MGRRAWSALAVAAITTLAIVWFALRTPGEPSSSSARHGERESASKTFVRPTATTDINGEFVIENLPAGQYDLVARSPFGSARKTGVAAGAENVELRLPALGAIEGVLEGFKASATVTAYTTSKGEIPRVLRATVTGTTFTFERVPVGTYEVTARSDDGFARATANVDAKTAARVVLRHQGFGVIVGRVLRETTREPVADITCMSVSLVTETDASGSFRFERVKPGPVRVVCMDDEVSAHAKVEVVSGKTAHVELLVRKMTPPTPTRGVRGAGARDSRRRGSREEGRAIRSG